MIEHYVVLLLARSDESVGCEANDDEDVAFGLYPECVRLRGVTTMSTLKLLLLLSAVLVQ